MYYRLDELDAVPVSRLGYEEWRKHATPAHRYTVVGDIHIGTRFLGIPAGDDPYGRPLLWETSILWPADEPGEYLNTLIGLSHGAWAALETHINAVELAERHADGSYRRFAAVE